MKCKYGNGREEAKAMKFSRRRSNQDSSLPCIGFIFIYVDLIVVFSFLIKKRKKKKRKCSFYTCV